MKALKAVGADAVPTADPAVVRRADKLVLPGVEHFSSTVFLEESGLKRAIEDRVAAGVPFLGICVGLQWLFEGSTEAPDVAGFKAFTGYCERFPENIKVPHVGWNSIEVKTSRLLKGISNGDFVYFTHSYRAPIVTSTVAVTEYDSPFTAAVE